MVRIIIFAIALVFISCKQHFVNRNVPTYYEEQKRRKTVIHDDECNATCVSFNQHLHDPYGANETALVILCDIAH